MIVDHQIANNHD
jgi:hypothetical protein